MKGPSLSLDDPAVRTLKPAIDLGPQKDAVLNVFFAFHIIGGHVGLPLALATMVIVKSVARRHPTLINLLVSWIVYATANLLLLYSGEALKENPEFGVCLAQASMIYGSTVGVAAATLCLVVQLWLEFRGHRLAKDSRFGSLANIQLLLLPWASTIFITMGSAVYGAKNPEKVSKEWQFYCTLRSSAVIYTVSGSTLVFIAATLALQASVLRTLFKATRQFRAANQTSYHLVLRIGIFAIYSVITFIVSILITLQPTSIFAYLFVSTLPLAAFLTFGTQKENIRFWFRSPGSRKTNRHIPLTPMTFKPATLRVQEAAAPLSVRSDKQLPESPKA